jgi:hypothetical protein
MILSQTYTVTIGNKILALLGEDPGSRRHQTSDQLQRIQKSYSMQREPVNFAKINKENLRDALRQTFGIKTAWRISNDPRSELYGVTEIEYWARNEWNSANPVPPKQYSMPKKIFISYSRRERTTAGFIARLLRVAGAGVFRDEDSIWPGKKWRTEISNALHEADVVLVLWTLWASQSDEVRAEYEEAIQLGKDIVPIILEEMPLPEALTEYQYINAEEVMLPCSPEGSNRVAIKLCIALQELIFAH